MELFKLYPKCPQKVNGFNVDPELDWCFDDIVSELNVLKLNLNTSYIGPLSSSKTVSRDLLSGNEIERGKSFVMRVPRHEIEDTGIDDEEKIVLPQKQFTCDEHFLRDMPSKNEIKRGKSFIMQAPRYEMEDTEIDDEEEKIVLPQKWSTCDEHFLSDSDNTDTVSVHEVQPYLMNEVGHVEGALFELMQIHHFIVKDKIINQISAWKTALINETEKYTSALLQVEKYIEARQELDRKLDTQYQQWIADVLDNHLTAVQWDCDLRSQIEERKIRSDAAYEEAKRKEKALQEEKLRQEKIKAEIEAKFKAEKARRAALETETKAAREAQKRVALEANKRAATRAKESDSIKASQSVTCGGNQEAALSSSLDAWESGNAYQAVESALNLEHRRLQKLKELYERNQEIRSSSYKDYTRVENHIGRLIKQISGITDNVRSKASDLIKLLNDPQCYQSIGIDAFVRKVVSRSGNLGNDNTAFATAYVIVLVTSEVPHAMDFVLAEFHKACIYTVPKHLVYTKTAFESEAAYFKGIGYQEEGGMMESNEDYFKRLNSYMKVYGALVQTEIPGVQNVHGLEEGWAWLAKFLNAIPPNKYTAVSLNAFLQAAGFALFRRYKAQFMKILNVILDHFLVVLKAQQESDLTATIVEMESYIKDMGFLQEPQGRRIESNVLSREWRY